MMGKVTTQFTMSLDGFIAGSNDEVDRIFKWYGSGDVDFPVEGSDMVFKVSQASADYLSEEWGQLGAIVTGRRDFDVSNAWGGETVLGVPTFIVTHSPPEEWVGKQPLFIFVTDGVESAIAQAREAAGDKNVSVGGTTIVQQCLKLGLIDEIRLDMAPILLGEGIRLFDKLGPEPIELEQIGVIEGKGVTHVQYRVVK
jgi:dihydrofolate reductase